MLFATISIVESLTSHPMLYGGFVGQNGLGLQ